MQRYICGNFKIDLNYLKKKKELKVIFKGEAFPLARIPWNLTTNKIWAKKKKKK